MEPSLSLSPDDDDEWSRVSSDRQSMLSQDGSSECAITELLVSPERRLSVGRCHDAGSGPSLSCQHVADPSGFHLSICKRLSRNHSSYLIFTELRITFWATGAVGRASSSAPFPHPQLQTWSGASSAPQ